MNKNAKVVMLGFSLSLATTLALPVMANAAIEPLIPIQAQYYNYYSNTGLPVDLTPTAVTPTTPFAPRLFPATTPIGTIYSVDGVTCFNDVSGVTCTMIPTTGGTPFAGNSNDVPTTSGGNRPTPTTRTVTTSPGTNPTATSNATDAELRARITALLNQLNALLQARKAGGGSVSGTTGLTVAATAVATQPLKVGSRGENVKTLQRYLISKGQTIRSGATGYFGPQTKAALIAWQAANGVPSTGFYGPKSEAKARYSTVE